MQPVRPIVKSSLASYRVGVRLEQVVRLHVAMTKAPRLMDCLRELLAAILALQKAVTTLLEVTNASDHLVRNLQKKIWNASFQRSLQEFPERGL